MTRRHRAAALMVAIAMTILTVPAVSEGGFSFSDLPQEVRPGKMVLLAFTAALSEDVDILVTDAAGAAVPLYEDFPAKAGRNTITWDAMREGVPFPAGNYLLTVTGAGGDASASITIGPESPVLLNVMPSDTTVLPGTQWHMHVEASMPGTLTMRLEETDTLLFEGPAAAGENDIPWDGTASGAALAPGSYTLVVQLADDTGFASNATYIPISVEAGQAAEGLAGVSGDAQASYTNNVVMTADQRPPAPADYSTHPSNGELNYWTLPMDIKNEATIWEVMMQPITVLKGDQKQFFKLRAQPDEGAAIVGEITYDSQSVRVLDTLDNGWSLIEAYSSSFKGSPSEAWAQLVQGYVKTSLLQTKKPSDKYGLIIDKLTQRLYVFKDGKLFTQLLISTGLANEKQPYNETQAGEYLIVSRVGKFMSDNLHCEMALRFNNGNLIHQVPYTLRADGSKYFDKTEPKLGTKASHGCVRVQRKKNAQGVNMTWLWSNLELNTKVLIWEDYKGRQLSIPSADTPLYYNPDGGTLYHNDPNCLDVKAKYLPLKPFTYGQLDEAPFDSLSRCLACAPPMRQSELEAINASYLEQ